MSEGCVVIQTCDAYSKYWPGLIYSMNKYWDFNIPWPIYFCNEEINVDFGPNYKQLLTGKHDSMHNLKFILDYLKEYEYVFLMIEDFWPVNPMSQDMFLGLFDIFKMNNWDSLRVSTFEPSYYKVKPSGLIFKNTKILKFTEESDWHFSMQAAFWKRDFLRSCLVESDISDAVYKTSLPSEIACDQNLKKLYPNAEIYHYHYFWYPMSGVVWRGEFTEIGKQIEVVMNIENLLKSSFQDDCQS